MSPQFETLSYNRAMCWNATMTDENSLGTAYFGSFDHPGVFPPRTVVHAVHVLDRG